MVSRRPELLPSRSLFDVAEPVLVEVRNVHGPAVLRVRSLGDVVGSVPVDAAGVADLGPLASGGYGVELFEDGAETARTAVQVLAAAEHRSVLRYGFVADYRSDREFGAFADNVRRLHLTAVQFYDWAHRHADLLGGGEQYADALGNPVALQTVRELVRRCRDAGAEALGYAAVYAVGDAEWDRWSGLALRTASGEPYGLGGFLRLVDPAAEPWATHLGDDLAAASAAIGFDGFHLDQYGYPKQALGVDGTVDVATSFVRLLGRLRRRLPSGRLVFNNVNDFPTWLTAAAPQDAVYVEVWEPNTRYADLARIVTRARLLAGGKPVVVAAYQHVYATAPVEQADRATALTMATLFSHGATHLLAGEADRVLVDPYYVRNHPIGASTAGLLRRWYDFLVEHHELLMPAHLVDVTASYTGDYNGDLDVTYQTASVSQEALPGQVWRRVTQAGDRLVVHLVNLVGQQDTRWDDPHCEPADPGPGRLRLRLVGGRLPEVRAADPDGSGRLESVAVRCDGDVATAVLPPLRTWQLVLVRSR